MTIVVAVVCFVVAVVHTYFTFDKIAKHENNWAINATAAIVLYIIAGFNIAVT